MTKEDHLILYEELKSIFYDKSIDIENLTQSQFYFLEGLEQGSLEVEFLKMYSDMVDDCPDISVRDLHAFCLGYGMSKVDNIPEIDLNKKYH